MFTFNANNVQLYIHYECTKLYTIQWLHYRLHHKVGQSYFDVRNTWEKATERNYKNE